VRSAGVKKGLLTLSLLLEDRTVQEVLLAISDKLPRPEMNKTEFYGFNLFVDGNAGGISSSLP
jgi:hypothetical protein